MKNLYTALILGLFALASCQDGDDPTDFFDLEPRTTYNISLTGTFADSLYFKNDTLQQWEYVYGDEELTGVMYVNFIDADQNYTGYIEWDNGVRSFQEKVVRQLFTQWDTASNIGTNESTVFTDSVRPIAGRLRDFTIGWRNDSLPILLGSKNLQFTIADQTSTKIEADAGYQVRSTVIEGHPDSTEFLYNRRFWNLDHLSIRKP